ncbi:MAG: hypothetical protein Q8P67_24175 [archaeon]|nr:hypothetical protein [archaeon]
MDWLALWVTSLKALEAVVEVVVVDAEGLEDALEDREELFPSKLFKNVAAAIDP